MTVYPGAIDILEACENEAVLQIEETLGINPQGTYTSVVTRLDSVDQRLSDSERIFKSSEYGGIQQAIDAAFAAGGGIALLPWGVTLTPAPNPTTGAIYMLKAGVSVMGFGAQSVLKIPDGAGNFLAMFDGAGLDDISLTNFTIDGNQAGNAPVDVEAFDPIRDGQNNITGFNKPRMALRLNGARIVIAGVAVKALDAINHVHVTGAGVQINDSTFEAAGTFEHDMSILYTSGGDGARIVRNYLAGNAMKRCAIETHTSDLYVRENSIRSCATAMNLTGFVLDPLGTYAITVKDNHILDCGAGVKVYSGVYGQTPDNQQTCDVVIADNIIRLNSTLWPDATVDRAIYYYQFNTKPVGAQIIRDNMIRVTA